MQEAALAQAKPAPPSDVDKAPRVSPPARSAQSYLRASNDPIAPEDNDLTIWDNRRAHALMARPHGRAVADMVELQRVATSPTRKRVSRSTIGIWWGWVLIGLVAAGLTESFPYRSIRQRAAPERPIGPLNQTPFRG